MRRLARSFYDRSVDKCFVDADGDQPWARREGSQRLLRAVAAADEVTVLIAVRDGMSRADVEAAVDLVEVAGGEVLLEGWGPVRSSSRRFRELLARVEASR